jgi:hypothetical protein
LPPFDFTDVTELLKRLLCLICMVFFVREEVYLRGAVLENMGNDTVADASGATSYYVNLLQSAT